MANQIETSVRRALAKGNGDDPAFRVLVYEAAERAINRSEIDGKSDAAASDRQRQSLIAAVEAIEAEYPSGGRTVDDVSSEEAAGKDQAAGGRFTDEWAATTGDEDPVSSRSPLANRSEPDEDGNDLSRAEAESSFSDTPAGAVARNLAADQQDRTAPNARARSETMDGERSAYEGSIEPDERTRTDDDVGDIDTARSFDGDGDNWSPGHKGNGGTTRADRAKGPIRHLVSLVIVLLVVFLVAVAGYLLVPFVAPGLFSEAPERDPIAEAIQSSGAAVADDEGWVTAFSGSDLSGLAERSKGRAEVIESTDGTPAVRVEPGPGDSSGNDTSGVAIVLTGETLDALPGGTVRAELTVGSPDATPREFTVQCELGGESVCGRQRFSTSRSQETFIFDMTLPTSSDGSGEVVVDPQIGERSGDLDIYRLRLRNG